ncbi:MAG: SpoIIE family protein phosphatase [Candidatus Cloacimonetes bacterium]|nr:SpoIIE family protein phosphatase [Candidatus Cloacimonadota bacterium]
MPKSIIGAVIIFSLLLLAFTQAAQSPQTDILKQYQKIQSEAKNYRLFSYNDGAPKGNYYSTMVDNFGYLWIVTDGAQVHRFNGSSFMDVLAQLPATERDSLLDSSLTQDNDKRIYLTGKHYLYRWNGYKLLKYAFPKDDRIRECRMINGKLLAVGTKGYAVLNYDKWAYIRISTTYDIYEGLFIYRPNRDQSSLSKWEEQECYVDNKNRLYLLHYYKYYRDGKNNACFIAPEEDFNISRYSAAGIETLPCLTKAERHKLFFQGKLEFSPVFWINPQSEVSIVFRGTEYRYQLDASKGAFCQNILKNCKLLYCNSSLGSPHKVIAYSRADTLFIEELGYPQPEYYYPNYRTDRNYHISYKQGWLTIHQNYSVSEELLKVVPGLSYMIPVITPELNTSSVYRRGQNLYKGNNIVYVLPDPKLTGLHTVYLIDVAKNTCQTLQVADEALSLSILDYNVNNNSVLLVGQDDLLRLSMVSATEKVYSYPKMSVYSGSSLLHTKWDTAIAIREWEAPRSNLDTRLLINCSGSIKELLLSGELIEKHTSNEKSLLELVIKDGEDLSIERINLSTGKVISQSSLDKLLSASYFNEAAFFQNKDLTYSLQSPDSSITGNIKAITQPWYEILDTQRIVRDDLPKSLSFNLVDEETIFIPSSEYEITNNKNGSRELSETLPFYDNPPLPPEKTVLSGNPPDKFLSAALLYDCKANKVYEKPNWVRAFKVQDKWIDKTKIVYIDKQEKVKALRISDYYDRDVKQDKSDFVFPLSGNYLPNYELFIDYDCYFQLIDKMLYYEYKGVWDKLATGDKPLYGNLKSVNRDNNDLWLVYDSALIRFSLTTHQSFVFTSRDGLPEDLLNMYEVDGKHFLVTRSGIYSFAPQEEGSTMMIPWLTANGVKYSSAIANKFNYKQNSIIIPVDILNSMFPERVKLSYRLLGYEKDWKQRDYSPQIEYPKLPPGRYEFQVYGTSHTGLQCKPISAFFVIKSPLYGRWWAFLSYVLLLAYLVRYLYRLRIRQLNRRTEVLEQTAALRTSELQEKQRHIQESIEYASLIQKSILPQVSDLALAFKEHFIIWKPRDIVGGDFYWLHTLDSGELMFAVIDCTGHGVPGALLSMTVNSLLEHLVHDRGMRQPAEIFSELHRRIGSTLHQDKAYTQQDGIEISLLRIDKAAQQLVFCGAGLHLLNYDVATHQMAHIRGNRYGIGGLKWHQELQFTEQQLSYSAHSRFYLYTDGIIDQPAPRHDKRRRLGQPAWLELVSSLAEQPLPEQQTQLNERIDTMLAYHEQRDDITIVGLRIQ